MNHPVIPDHDYKQVQGGTEYLRQVSSDLQTEAYQRYVDEANAWAKERQRIFNLGVVEKKKSRFSWHRILTFLTIYFGYCIAGYFVNKFFPSFYLFLLAWPVFGAAHWIMGIKFGDYFWQEKE